MKTKDKPISEMDIGELVSLCHGKICESDGCYRECQRGCRFCIQCMHGTSNRADDFYVAAKKRLTKLLALLEAGK